MTAETFGQMLRRLRVAAGYSQNELARRAGVNAAYVNQIEAHKLGKSGMPISPSRSVVLAFAQVFDLDDSETDRALWVAGLAPQTDWQARAEAAEGRLEMLRQTFDVPSDLLVFRRRTG